MHEHGAYFESTKLRKKSTFVPEGRPKGVDMSTNGASEVQVIVNCADWYNESVEHALHSWAVGSSPRNCQEALSKSHARERGEVRQVTCFEEFRQLVLRS